VTVVDDWTDLHCVALDGDAKIVALGMSVATGASREAEDGQGCWLLVPNRPDDTVVEVILSEQQAKALRDWLVAAYP
jgi:hypothetical protein